jgi:hypothetical protein
MRGHEVPIVQQSGNPPLHRGYAARARSIAWTLLSRGVHRDNRLHRSTRGDSLRGGMQAAFKSLRVKSHS